MQTGEEGGEGEGDGIKSEGGWGGTESEVNRGEEVQ